jgi:hypothetical protein
MLSIQIEMRCLRKAVNKTKRDQVRNEEIRKTVVTTPVINFIENQRLKWFGHLMRMNPTMPAARAYNKRRESQDAGEDLEGDGLREL